MAASCVKASTINTDSNTEWFGRNKTTVVTLNSWEDLYVPASYFKPNLNEGKSEDMSVPGFYVKQIWIHNCWDGAIGALNDKRFSVRLYTDNSIVRTLDGSGNIIVSSASAEMILADHINVPNGERIALLDEGSPLHLSTALDKIQIQANTSIRDWTISCWVENSNQYFETQFTEIANLNII